MRFQETPLAGAFVVEPERHGDERGYFARTFCVDEFAARGLEARIVQCSTSFNRKRGTLRGLHFQTKPREEDKLVRCTRGCIFDVMVDLRPESETYKKWFGAELSAENGRALYIPRGFAHGFQTLADGTEVLYQMSEFYHPESGRGLRWDDPAFGIQWPLDEMIISDKDRSLPVLADL